MPDLLAPPLPEVDAHAAKVGDALLERLRADPVLSGWAGGADNIDGWDVEDLLLTSTTWSPPAIGLLLAGFDIIPDGSNRQTRLETLWEVLFALPPIAPRTAAGRWLSARLALHLWVELERTLGVLYGPPTGIYPDGEPLTLALLRMQRVPAVRRTPTGVLLLPVRLILSSILSAATGDLYDG